MKKISFLILSLLLLSLSPQSKADIANWRLHPTFDQEVGHVVDTPDYVYFTSKPLKVSGDMESYSYLFRYDKKGEELLPLSTNNMLSSTSIRDMVYNPSKGYLCVLYKDFTIDLIFNNGTVVSIPYYEQSNLNFPKNVASINIDPDHDRIYMATDFGYIAINDKKHEIAESRIYGEPLKAYCRMGDFFLAIRDGEILKAPAESHRLSLDQYETIGNFYGAASLHPINDSKVILLIKNDDGTNSVKKLTITDSGLEEEDVYQGKIHSIENTPSGILMASGGTIWLFKPNGDSDGLGRLEGYTNSAVGGSNLSELWFGAGRKGLSSIKKSGGEWKVTRDWMAPNAPATFASTSYYNHPSLGFLMLNFGYVPATSALNTQNTLQLSGVKQGRWTNYAPAYTNSPFANVMYASNGMAIDPDNSNYVYISSYHNGILRLNLKDPKDLIHMGRSELWDADQDIFAVLGPEQNNIKGYWNITAPMFDPKGNLWMYFSNYDDTDDPNPHYYCWTAEDRRATTTAKDVRLPKIVEFNTYFPQSNQTQILVLKHTGNGWIVHTGSQYEEMMAIFDTNGTPEDTSDDHIYRFPEFIDSDGNKVDVSLTRYLWEDPATGYVWVCHRNGVFYFVPSQVKQGNYQIYRVKVARNDGTNLADYLLDGVSVNHVAADSEGRKWFATAGGGIVCTSSDGREILEEFTTANSPLPDDVVYGIGYNSETNSLMFSTAQGYAEYLLPVSSNSSTKEDVRAYPNPVRPDYSGYVTITDIPTGSFVKIADAGGNLVKELGIMSGFDILWDLSDANFNRVKSGVYYILISPSDEYSKYSTVGKILVIS
ncbi:MAG: hypothetical protein J1D77_06605 [Muribaculaceae bacterium]|nr:hypothetical protein [Muribaculaceae bacterium]